MKEIINPEIILRQNIINSVSIADHDLDQVISHFNLETFRKGKIIIEEGKHVAGLYFVVEGLLKLVYNTEDGQQHILAFAMENCWESDFQAFLTQSPATLSLVCLENSIVYCIPFTSYELLCKQYANIAQFTMNKINEGYLNLQDRLLTMFTLSLSERYDKLLESYPCIGQRVSKTQIAAYLNVSRESLSRLGTPKL